jgi:hypothetical protein
LDFSWYSEVKCFYTETFFVIPFRCIIYNWNIVSSYKDFLSSICFLDLNLINSMFVSVVAVVFQITFRVEMHVNDFFYFLKNYFWHQHIRTIQNIQIILNFNKNKILNFLGTRFAPRSQTVSKMITYYSNKIDNGKNKNSNHIN